MVAEFLGECVGSFDIAFYGNEGHDALSFDFVGTSHDRRLGDCFVFNKGTFHFGSPQAVAGDVKDVIETADDPEVALLVSTGSVTGSIHAFIVVPVSVAITLFVAIDAAKH